MSQLHDLTTELGPLGQLFRTAGYSLYLVGGIVRDGLLGTVPPLADPRAGDIDLTTEARPDDILRIVRPLATALWTQGERFGTIGAEVFGRPLEITTHRAEHYDAASRKPTVTFGDDLVIDLSRRDFTINAMAIDLAAGELIDPYGGEADLAARRLRTPLDPRVSFGDDPLRMLRAARFIPRFDLTPDPDLVVAVEELRSRLTIVSVERIHDEIERLLGVDDPTTGLRFALNTGLLAEALGEPAGSVRLRLGSDLVPGGTTVLERRSRLLWPFGLADAGALLRRLRYSNNDRDTTLRQLTLCELLRRARSARQRFDGPLTSVGPTLSMSGLPPCVRPWDCMRPVGERPNGVLDLSESSMTLSRTRTCPASMGRSTATS
ncbi:MAG: hypothetical protein R2706_06755 [Acidimicrobiales bacterium]